MRSKNQALYGVIVILALALGLVLWLPSGEDHHTDEHGHGHTNEDGHGHSHEADDVHQHDTDGHDHTDGEGHEHPHDDSELPEGWHIDPGDDMPHRDHDHEGDDHGHDHGETGLPEGWHVDPGDPTPHRDHDHDDDHAEEGHGHDHAEAELPEGWHVDPGDPTPHRDHDHDDDHSEEGHGHDHAEEDHGHGHGHGDGGRNVQFTIWSDELEVFAERPFVVAGESAPFVTHVSYMETGKPRTTGPAIFVMEKDGKRIAHTEDAPKRDGIYIPELVFPEAGEWSLQLLVPTEDEELKTSLPTVSVHADEEEAARAPDPVEPEGIGYLKEQQWKTPFRIALPEPKGSAVEVPESAIMTHDGTSYVFVQLAGETFAKRQVRVSPSAAGMAIVEEGLSPAEYVVTLGAASIALSVASSEAEGHGHEGEDHPHPHGDGDHAHGDEGHGHPHEGDDTGHMVDDHGHEHEANYVNPTPEQKARFGIEVGQAQRGSLAEAVQVPGTVSLRPNGLAHVTPRAGGVVREVIADIGDTVKQGDVLAVVDSRELGNAKAAYLAAQSRRALAQATWEREERLFKQEITSEQDYLSAKYALAEADIALRNARRELLTLGLTKDGISAISSQAEESLSLFDVVAPIAGTIIERRVVLGETIEQTTEVFYIADLSSVCVDLVLTQREAARVRKGSPATIRSTSEDVAGSGTVSYVAPLVDAETRTTTARIVLPNEEERWRPGMSVEGLIHGAETGDTVVVSTDSVQYVEERPCVFVHSDHGFELREVLTGLSDEDHAEVTKGLRPGERIAVQGAFHLKAEFEKLASGGPVGHGHVH